MNAFMTQVSAYHQTDSYTLYCGDSLEVMADMEDESVDAVVTDPPYALSFMGRKWDKNLPPAEYWQEVLRVLKPSCYLLSFGGTRTWHRLAVLIEDTGFEIRDTLMWLYGTGFPKGRTCLKPAWEPIILARKPGPSRELSIDECKGVSGRWPTNLVLDEQAARILDEEAGTSKSTRTYRSPDKGGTGNVYTVPHPKGAFRGYDDSGGVSRFFYCPKASRAERNAGCGGLPSVEVKSVAMGDMEYNPDPRTGELRKRNAFPRQNNHPTVKPVALMRWLVRLISREGETVMDPFMGSGSTGIACVKEGRIFVGIESESEYTEIAQRRVDFASAQQALEVEG